MCALVAQTLPLLLGTCRRLDTFGVAHAIDSLIVNLRDFDFEERKLLTYGQVIEHVVLCHYFECHSQDGGQEQAISHRAAGEGGRGCIHGIIAMQVVHALAQSPPNLVIIEDEDLRQLLVVLKFVEGLEKPFVAV